MTKTRALTKLALAKLAVQPTLTTTTNHIRSLASPKIQSPISFTTTTTHSLNLFSKTIITRNKLSSHTTDAYDSSPSLDDSGSKHPLFETIDEMIVEEYLPSEYIGYETYRGWFLQSMRDDARYELPLNDSIENREFLETFFTSAYLDLIDSNHKAAIKDHPAEFPFTLYRSKFTVGYYAEGIFESVRYDLLEASGRELEGGQGESEGGSEEGSEGGGEDGRRGGRSRGFLYFRAFQNAVTFVPTTPFTFHFPFFSSPSSSSEDSSLLIHATRKSSLQRFFTTTRRLGGIVPGFNSNEFFTTPAFYVTNSLAQAYHQVLSVQVEANIKDPVVFIVYKVNDRIIKGEELAPGESTPFKVDEFGDCNGKTSSERLRYVEMVKYNLGSEDLFEPPEEIEVRIGPTCTPDGRVGVRIIGGLDGEPPPTQVGSNSRRVFRYLDSCIWKIYIQKRG